MEWAAEGDSAQADDRDRRLDAEFGGAGGDIGVPALEHPPPPAKVDAPSAAASGAGASTGGALAHRALDADPQIGLLLPCNVVLQVSGGGVVLSIADPRAMFDLVENPSLDSLVSEANERLRRVLDTVS